MRRVLLCLAAIVLRRSARAAPGALRSVSIAPSADVGLPFWCDWSYDWEARCFRDDGPRLPIGGVDDKVWRAAFASRSPSIPAGATVTAARAAGSTTTDCASRPRATARPCAAPGAVIDAHRILSSNWFSEREPDFDERVEATAVVFSAPDSPVAAGTSPPSSAAGSAGSRRTTASSSSCRTATRASESAGRTGPRRALRTPPSGRVSSSATPGPARADVRMPTISRARALAYAVALLVLLTIAGRVAFGGERARAGRRHAVGRLRGRGGAAARGRRPRRGRRPPARALPACRTAAASTTRSPRRAGRGRRLRSTSSTSPPRSPTASRSLVPLRGSRDGRRRPGARRGARPGRQGAPQLGDARATRRAPGRRAGDRAADPRLPGGERSVPLGRRARRGAGNRPGAPRAASPAGRPVSRDRGSCDASSGCRRRTCSPPPSAWVSRSRSSSARPTRLSRSPRPRWRSRRSLVVDRPRAAARRARSLLAGSGGAAFAWRHSTQRPRATRSAARRSCASR